MKLVVAAGCVFAASTAHADPAQLDTLLAQYDKLPDGAEKTALADEIDQVAGQKYATVSRLYWYTDLDEAEAAARQTGHPILALRMLGDLREDLSCANSRLFRSTLYANKELAAFLRSHFVLYWSSERPVPKVTIDFGDGRKIERTTTGNSIHYVLDADGRVIDALPGLYAPSVFQRELAKSERLAQDVARLAPASRDIVLARYHANAVLTAQRAWAAARPAAPGSATAIASAQRVTVTKRVMEAPDLAKLGAMSPNDLPKDDVAAWSAIGRKLYAAKALDAASRALVERLWGDGDREEMLARLEQHILADTALNELSLRPQIQRQLAAGTTDFATLNAWVYDVVFHTPKSDPWLGLNPRTDFTGLPDDGVVMR